jgi:hypothetical protein
MSITAEDIKKVVLADDDFGFELRVGNVLNNVAHPSVQFIPVQIMRPHHGGTYEDPATAKTRQFDYRSQIFRGHDKTQHIHLAVECKNLNPELPLVVCGRARTRDEAYHVFIPKADGEERLMRKVKGNNSLYDPSKFVGKSILRLKMKDKRLCSDGDSEIYDKWSQALASCQDLAMVATHRPPPTQEFAFVMPLVVVPDDSLWIAEYSNEGSLVDEPKKVNQCEFYVDKKLQVGVPFVVTHIHFVTVTGLSNLLAEYANGDSNKWDKIFCEASSVFNPTH